VTKVRIDFSPVYRNEDDLRTVLQLMQQGEYSAKFIEAWGRLTARQRVAIRHGNLAQIFEREVIKDLFPEGGIRNVH
jgi:hypothetical protein